MNHTDKASFIWLFIKNQILRYIWNVRKIHAFHEWFNVTMWHIKYNKTTIKRVMKNVNTGLE